MNITERLLNALFNEEGLKFVHDDEMRPNANYFWVSSVDYPGVYLRVYAGAEGGGNLTNRYSVNDQYVSGVLCLDTDMMELYDDEAEFEYIETGSDYEGYLSSDQMLEDTYLLDTPCIAYLNQENVTEQGYLNFEDDITTISKVADNMYRQLADAVA